MISSGSRVPTSSETAWRYAWVMAGVRGSRFETTDISVPPFGIRFVRRKPSAVPAIASYSLSCASSNKRGSIASGAMPTRCHATICAEYAPERMSGSRPAQSAASARDDVWIK